MSDYVICASCGHHNNPQAVFCESCGDHLRASIFGEAGEDTVFVSGAALSDIINDSGRAYFGREARVHLHPINGGAVIEVPDFTTGIVLGRGPAESKLPLLDLSAYDAKAQGVSREHAYLTRVNATLVLEDAGTLNGTYLNGKRISPVQASIVCDGDTVGLGKLTFEIRFQQ